MVLICFVYFKLRFMFQASRKEVETKKLIKQTFCSYKSNHTNKRKNTINIKKGLLFYFYTLLK